MKKRTNRRTLRFNSLDEVLTDARTMANAKTMAIGNWTTGQILGHIARSINGSIDGILFKVPLPVRIIGRIVRNVPLRRGLLSGVKIPANARDKMIPEPDLPIDQAMEQLAKAIDRVKQERMCAAHPIFGRLSHEQWSQFHCRHAELHFSFLQSDQRRSSPPTASLE